MRKPKSVTLSAHQREVVLRMRLGAQLFECIMHLRTKLVLQKKGVIDEKMQLTELGDTLPLD